jgi:hypothetical protein
MFHSGAMLIGTTGWMFSVDLNPSPVGPAPKSKFCWNGTLISEAIGFDSCLARLPAASADGAAEVLASDGAASSCACAAPARQRLLPTNATGAIGCVANFTICLSMPSLQSSVREVQNQSGNTLNPGRPSRRPRRRQNWAVRSTKL